MFFTIAESDAYDAMLRDSAIGELDDDRRRCLLFIATGERRGVIRS